MPPLSFHRSNQSVRHLPLETTHHNKAKRERESKNGTGGDGEYRVGVALQYSQFTVEMKRTRSCTAGKYEYCFAMSIRRRGSINILVLDDANQNVIRLCQSHCNTELIMVCNRKVMTVVFVCVCVWNIRVALR